MSDVREDLGYGEIPPEHRAPPRPAAPPPPPEPLTGALVLPLSLLAKLRGVAKGRVFSRRLDTLFALDELARGGLITRVNGDAPWTLTEAGKQYLDLVAQRRRDSRAARRGARGAR